MDLLDTVLLLVIALIVYQLFLATTQGRIYGRNTWYSFSADWIYAKKQSFFFYLYVTTYSIGLIGAIVVLALKTLK